MSTSTDGPQWRRAKECGNGACVEVAKAEDHYLVRDSKHPDDPALHFTGGEWAAFVKGVRDGDFDFG